jgi:PhzF family phenazine biosynthesis protein
MKNGNCRLFLVDAFTRQRFCGNPAHVVLDADKLSDEQMQAIATEVNRETAFVIEEADGNDHDMQVRFFTPRHEVPFVGHVTVAAHYVRAKVGGKPPGRVRQRTGAGIVEVEVTEAEGDLRVAIAQSPPSLGPTIPEHHRKQVLDALGISSPSLHKDAPLQILAKGSTRLLICLRDPEMLSSLKPDFEALTRLTPHVGADGYFVFALSPTDAGPETESRMFCPALGIPEDPVSGNAHGMLGVFLVTHGLLGKTENVVRFRGRQGHFVRRPGIVDVEVETTGKVAQSVRITGDATIVYEAELPI